MSTALTRMRFLREQWTDRFLRSRGPLHPPLTLVYRRIFILPTAFGWIFGGLLAVMTIGGLNFNNNLGLLLTFILAASAHATLHMAYSNLRGMRITGTRSHAVFAGETARLFIQLQDTESRQRPDLMVNQGPRRAALSLKADAREQLYLPVPTTQRGWQNIARVRISTSYPIGLFVAWSWFEPESRILVYPKPASDAPPLPKGADEIGRVMQLREGEDLVGLRDYRPGDPMPSIAWKASARHNQVQTKLLARPAGQRLVLDWDTLGGMQTERRLSILCAWIISADQTGLTYRLRLPGVDIGPDRGPRHRDACLKALALYGVPE